MEVDGLPDGHGAGKHSGFSGSVAHSHIVPDVDRVIAHFDVDCFYAQVREQCLAQQDLGLLARL